MPLGGFEAGYVTPAAWLARPACIAAERRPSLRWRLLLPVTLGFWALLWAFSPVTALAQEQTLSPQLEQRAHALYKQIMCPTCPGQNLDQSQAPIAANMRQIIRERLLAGDSDEAIRAFFVGAYGESILASPPRDGIGLAAWLVPPFALGLGGFAVFLAVRTLRRPTPASIPVDDRSEAEGSDSLDPYLQMVDDEMEGQNRPSRPPMEGRG